MSDSLTEHQRLTVIRAAAYWQLFGCKPSNVFAHTLWSDPNDEPYRIDVFVYTVEAASGEIEIAVTNGMSNIRMPEPDYPTDYRRRELIQYLPKCTEGHAKRLRDMAFATMFDGFHLDSHHTMEWKVAAVPGTPWCNAFFLLPLIKPHREYEFELDGEPVSFLWHIPISVAERKFILENGTDEFIDRMDAADLPWIFDEQNRPVLVE